MKQVVTTIIKLVISIGLLYVVLIKYDLRSVADSLFAADIFLLLIGLGLYALFTVVSAYRLYLVFALFSKTTIGFSRILQAYLIGSTYNIVLPTAIGGDVARAYYLRTPDHSLKRTAFLSVVDRALGLGFLVVLGIIGFLVIRPDVNAILNSQINMNQLRLLLLLGFLAGLGLLISLLYIFRTKVTAFLKQISRASVLGLIQLLVVSLFVQFLAVSIGYCLGLAFGIELEFTIYMLLIPFISIIVVLPISIGGIGLREVSSVTLFTYFGAAGPAVIAMSFAQYIYLLIAAGAGGLVLLWSSLNQITQLVAKKPDQSVKA